MRSADFERLYAAHAQGLFGFIAYRTGDRALAEELVAETFERALRGRRGFDRRKASEKTWLYTIALNCLRDRARRSQVEAKALERVAAATPARPDDIGRSDERDELARAMGELSPEERAVVALRFGGDLTVPEVARTLHLPLTTVEGRLYRALGKLRDRLS